MRQRGVHSTSVGEKPTLVLGPLTPASHYTGLEGQLGIYYGNKSHGVLQSFQVSLQPSRAWGGDAEHVPLVIAASTVEGRLASRQQTCQEVNVKCRCPFQGSPLMEIQFLLPDNTPRTLHLKLPVVVSKFMERRTFSAQDFFSLWRNESFILHEVTSIVDLAHRLRGSLIHLARCVQLGGALELLTGLDANPDNLVLAGVFASRESGVEHVKPAFAPSVVLTRIELGTGRHRGKIRIAVRSDSHLLAQAVRQLIILQAC
ncbi:unnamed protein product [Vitrella brassicaformis CCMP3155]|uniref:Clathrin adaptor alpha-adaptin appendage C-terminal subdomain domain-containing protein n=1 Tax=Vitrella brassicaformis (strain CCMP3155) TaxID=1169540 RepID=A0A0G4GP93_VITBC|nr:unnamed protein product [Vitrella brassicaformis CCMP3155]|eukprot:CEM32104.1 unnamed protein product [Vitrella brassicaformis CCMP3155]